MIGVILWSDTKDGKAVIWCEDHGDLAFFNSYEGTADDLGYLEAGDVIEFNAEVDIDGDFRRVSNPTRVFGHDAVDLTSCLRSKITDTRAALGNIIAFPGTTSSQVTSDRASEVAICQPRSITAR